MMFYQLYWFTKKFSVHSYSIAALNLCVLFVLLASQPIEANEENQQASVASTSENQVPDWNTLYKQTRNNPKIVIAEVNHYLSNNDLTEIPLQNLKAMEILCIAFSILEDIVNLNVQASNGLKLSQSTSNQKFESVFTSHLALVAVGDKEFQKANTYSLRAINLAKQQGDERIIAFAFTTHGQVLLEKGAYQAALVYFTKGYEIALKRKDNLAMVENLSDISVVYAHLGQRQESLDNLEKIISLLEEKESAMLLSITYYNLGVGYKELGKHSKGQDFLTQAKLMSLQLKDDVGIAYADYQLAVIEYNLNEFSNVQELIQASFPVFEKYNITRMIFLSHLLQARNDSMLQQGNPLKSLLKAKQLADKINTLRRFVGYHQSAAETFVNLENYKKAVVEYQTFQKLNNKLTNQNNELAVKNMQARFELLKGESENNLLKKEKELVESKLEQKVSQEIILYLALLITGLLISGIIFYLFTQILLRKRFQAMALRDQLTGVPNRRAILRYAEEELKLSKATKTPLLIAILDIDLFKNINDQYGHSVGDEVLKNFATACKNGIRETDMFGRYGGEEWLLIMPGSSESSVKPTFERINSLLKINENEQKEYKIKIQFSMGASLMSNKLNTIKKIIAAADKNLYQAKENGRNQFIV